VVEVVEVAPFSAIPFQEVTDPASVVAAVATALRVIIVTVIMVSIVDLARPEIVEMIEDEVKSSWGSTCRLL
jgi:hypothetical protein